MPTELTPEDLGPTPPLTDIIGVPTGMEEGVLAKCPLPPLPTGVPSREAGRELGREFEGVLPGEISISSVCRESEIIDKKREEPGITLS